MSEHIKPPFRIEVTRICYAASHVVRYSSPPSYPDPADKFYCLITTAANKWYCWITRKAFDALFAHIAENGVSDISFEAKKEAVKVKP